MKKWLVASLVLNAVLVAVGVGAAVQVPVWIRAFVETGAERRSSQFAILDERKGAIVFLGDSITAGGMWSELFRRTDVLNRGIGGDTTQDVLNRIDDVYTLAPRKLFVMVGINDLNTGVPVDTALANYEGLFEGFDRELPETRVYVQSVLPVNDDWQFEIDPADVDALNAKLEAESEQRGYRFVDLRPALSAADGTLDRAYSNDGIHLMGAGYEVWRTEIAEWVAE